MIIIFEKSRTGWTSELYGFWGVDNSVPRAQKFYNKQKFLQWYQARINKDSNLESEKDWTSDSRSRYDTIENINPNEELGLVVYDHFLIYNSWDSKFKLTYDLFHSWIKQIDMEKPYHLQHSLIEYLEDCYCAEN